MRIVGPRIAQAIYEDAEKRKEDAPISFLRFISNEYKKTIIKMERLSTEEKLEFGRRYDERMENAFAQNSSFENLISLNSIELYRARNYYFKTKFNISQMYTISNSGELIYDPNFSL